MNNKKYVWVVGGIIVVALSFYAGMTYGKNGATAQNTAGTRFAGGAGQRGGAGRNGGGFVSGQIIAKDANSITVELRPPGQNGSGAETQAGATTGSQGSKIVFYTDKTTVVKTVAGTAADLAVGKQVSVTGTANSDGSINADSVQIRPDAGTIVRQN